MWPLVGGLTAILTAWVSATPAQAGAKIMPRELVEFAERNDCRQIQDFFERPGMVKPPYVYGFGPGPEDASAAFWCERLKGGERRPVLMFLIKNGSGSIAKCPREIEWINPPPVSVVQTTSTSRPDDTNTAPGDPPDPEVDLLQQQYNQLNKASQPFPGRVIGSSR